MLQKNSLKMGKSSCQSSEGVRIMERLLKKLPIPIAGLMLGLAAAGNLILTYGDIYRNIFGLISSLILILLIAKFITIPKSIVKGFSNPVVASVMPTFSMGIMILSTYLKPHFSSLAFAMWICGFIIHVILMICFTKKYILNFNIKKVFPSYFIVYVGIAAASITAPAFGLSNLGQYVFWFAFLAYLVLLPVVLYRVFVVKGIPEPALPTIAIFAAPASLCLAGYMNSFQEKNMTLVTILTFLALFMTLCVILYLPRILKGKFYPSYSAFTFPFVVSGIAIKLTNGFLIKTGKGINTLKYIVKFQEIFSIAMVIYVLAKYTAFLFTEDQSQSKAKSAKLQ